MANLNRTSKPSVCLILLQYNKLELTVDCIKSILMHESTDLPVRRMIVADNASTDGDVINQFVQIKNLIPWAETIRFDENYGFAGAHNKLINTLQEDYVLLLNNDTWLINDAITKLITCSIRDEVDVATGSLFNADGTVQPNTKGYYFFPSPLRRMKLKSLKWFRERKSNVEKRDRCDSNDIVYANGAFLLVKSELFKRVGGFNESYFMYTEDLDLMIKFNKEKAKMRSYKVPSVVHLGGASSELVWGNKEKFILQIKQGNEALRKHYGFLSSLFWGIAYAAFALLISVPSLIFKRKWGLVFVQFRSVFWRLRY